MSEEVRRILEMLAQGKISVAESEQLLNSIGIQTNSGRNDDSSGKFSSTIPGWTGSQTASGRSDENAEAQKAAPKYLHVVVHESGKDGGGKGGDVNIRVPLNLLRSGIKLAALIPIVAREKVAAKLKEKGIAVDLSKIKPDDLEEVIGHLRDLSIDVNCDKDQVRIYCE
ncbi:MAG TPA: hypothetical protein VGL91_04125 [Acidobacteriota bacterium]|jgi:hypothetical protein